MKNIRVFYRQFRLTAILAVSAMLIPVCPSAVSADEPAHLRSVIRKEFYSDNTLKAERRYTGGLLNGESRFYNPDGTLAQTCEYQNDRPHGLLKKYHPDGTTLESEVRIEEDQYEGVRKSFYPNGNVKAEAHFEKGLLNGEARQYYENGGIQNEEVFRDDQITGTKKTYFPGGQLMSEACCYQAGVLNGESKLYYESGHIEWSLPFVGGKIHGLAHADYPDGAPKARVMYRDGLWDGESAEYYAGGAKLSEANFVSGAGIEKRYYESGELKEEIPYKDNAEEGTVRGLRKDGSLEFEDTYREGEKTSRKFYDASGKRLFHVRYTDWRLRLLFDLDRRYNAGQWDTASEAYPGGWIRSTHSFKDGALHGISEEYYDGLFQWVHFRDAYWHGTRINRKEFDPDGRILSNRDEANIYGLIFETAFSRPSSERRRSTELQK